MPKTQNQSEKWNALDQAIGPVPSSFSHQLRQTLTKLPDKKPRSRLVPRAVILAAALALLLCGAACAAILQGQDWYYSNRFTAYQQYEPEKYQAIMEHLVTAPPQETSAAGSVSVVVQDVSWAQEQQVLTVSLAAQTADAAQFEVHPLWNLDADGAYSDDPDDPEAHSQHYLWTQDGFGPVRKMMRDGSKTLLLFECDQILMDGELRIPGEASMDTFLGEDGQVITVLEASLDRLDEANDEWYRSEISKNPALASHYQSLLEKRQSARDIVAASNGELTLTLPYTVYTYMDEDDEAMRASAQQGSISFTLHIP